MLPFALPPTMSARKAECASRSIRILCLHGHLQSGQVFRKKTRALQKILERDANATLIYADAPHVVNQAPTKNHDISDSTEGESVDEIVRRTWWVPTPNGAVYNGWNETLEALASVWQTDVRHTFTSLK